MSNLEKFAAQYGLQIVMQEVEFKYHFNPASFPGSAPVTDKEQFSAIKGGACADDPETAYALITDGRCPFAANKGPDELCLIRVYADGVSTDCYDFPILATEAEQVADLKRLGFK